MAKLMLNALGITSACAEQTTIPITTFFATWDHLRVCGADHLVRSWMSPISGSPPRVRSRHRHARFGRRRVGITSACAEQTYDAESHAQEAPDHLRVCGADAEPMFATRI